MRKKKNNVGIIGGILILTMSFIFLVYKYCLYVPIKLIIKNMKKKKNNSSIVQPVVNKDKPKPIVSVHFKVAGVTFENRQKTIKKIVNESKNSIFHKPYFNMTNKEIIEDGNEIYEINHLSVNSLRLEPTTFKDEDAIEIYITDNNNNEFMMGYVPKHKIIEVQNFLKTYEEHPEYKLNPDAYFTGGKYKVGEINDEGKEVVKTYENGYGINVKLELYKQ